LIRMFKDIHQAFPRNAEYDIFERDLSLGFEFFVLTQVPIEQLHDTNVIYCVLIVNTFAFLSMSPSFVKVLFGAVIFRVSSEVSISLRALTMERETFS